MQTWDDCGHNKDLALRLRDKGKLCIFCIKCIVESCGVKDKNAAKEEAKDKLEKILEKGSKKPKTNVEKLYENGKTPDDKLMKETINLDKKEIYNTTKK